MNPQQTIARATEARGYREGWSDTQYLARQIAKLQEEISELAKNLTLQNNYDGSQSDIDWAVERAGQICRRSFDNVMDWDRVHLNHGDEDPYDQMLKEAADCFVVLCNIVETINRINGWNVDLVWMAINKAKDDVKRGVRS